MEKIECKICGKKLKSLGTHLSVHNISREEYLKRYPNAKMCTDEHRRKAIETLKNRKTGTYEEQFGKEKADKMKEAHRRRMKERIIDGTIPRKMSRPHRAVFDVLKGIYKDIIFAEYYVKYYEVDIAIPDKKIAIEVHGDYFHNKDNKPKEELSEIQKKSVWNDKRKSSFLKNKGWKLIIVWEGDINKNIKEVVEKIVEEIEKGNNIKKIDYSSIIKKCPYCGKEMSYEKISKNRKFCSKECSLKGRRSPVFKKNRKKIIREKKTYSKICVVCQKEFSFKKGEGISTKRKTCSNECNLKLRKKSMEQSSYNTERRKDGRVNLVCPCGNEFWAHRRSVKKNKSGTLFCSHKCYMKYHQRYNKEK